MKKTIMLIDDSVTIHRVIDLCVDKEKYNVIKVFNKDEAEQVIVSDKPDLILLDNKLPDIPTADMITLIKSECPACYIILLAGAFDQFDKDQCVSAGADDFLFKPFDAKALDARILCGLEGECEGLEESVPSEFTEEELEEIMPEEDEEIELPAIEEDETAAADVQPDEEIELPEMEEDIEIPAVEEEEIELPAGVFEGLKETEEEELTLPEDEPAAAAEPEPDFEPEIEPELEPEIEAGAELEEMPELQDIPELEIDQELSAEPAPEMPIALDDLELDIPEQISMPEDNTPVDMSDPFSGLVETDETVIDEEAAKEESAQSLDELETAQETDELDGILDGINEDIKMDEPAADLSEALEDAEESLAESEEELEEVISMGDETEQVIKELDNEEILPDEPSLELPEIEKEIHVTGIGTEMPEAVSEPEPGTEPEIEADILTDMETDMETDMADDIAVPAEEDIAEEAPIDEEKLADDEEPEEAAEEPEEAAEEQEIRDINTVELTPADEMEPEPEYREPEMPKVHISAEKLVEAVYEAIDEDTLKFAIKEVLTDKIGRILEEELPILVERAIRKEIERLVKGN
ncbi:MAG: response regulator [Deferribacterales bacterium]